MVGLLEKHAVLFKPTESYFKLCSRTKGLPETPNMSGYVWINVCGHKAMHKTPKVLFLM